MVVSAEDASPLLERASVMIIRFCVLAQSEQRANELALCSGRALVVRPKRAGPYGECRLQEHHRLRVLFRYKSETARFVVDVQDHPACECGSRVPA